MPELQNKYIRSDIGEISYGKPVYVISSKNHQTPLAQIGWYPNWKKYVMFAHDNTVWDAGCLTNIVEFLGTINGPEAAK